MFASARALDCCVRVRERERERGETFELVR